MGHLINLKLSKEHKMSNLNIFLIEEIFIANLQERKEVQNREVKELTILIHPFGESAAIVMKSEIIFISFKINFNLSLFLVILLMIQRATLEVQIVITLNLHRVKVQWKN